jgi:hypothetical protein
MLGLLKGLDYINAVRRVRVAYNKSLILREFFKEQGKYRFL